MRTSIQLMCFAHAGASAAPYFRWRRRLPAFIELVPVELPGRGRRRNEPFALTLEDALRAVEDAIGVPTRPFALFGHSLGASIAFAYAQRLRSRGARSPHLLFASASHAPGTRVDARGSSEREQDTDVRHEWSDQALRDELLRLDGTPNDVLSSPELLELALPVLRADYRLAADVAQRLSRAPIVSPIHVLAGTNDDIAASALTAWRAQTEGAFELSRFAGGHFYLHEHEPEVLDSIAGALACALAEPTLFRSRAEEPRASTGSAATRGGRDEQFADS